MFSFQDIQQNQCFQELVRIRRHLHQIPEIGLKQYQTSKFVRKYLENIPNVQVMTPIPNLQTAVIARINVQNSNDVFLYRCQLDALPWEQKSGLQFSSKNGLHHACGHDAHTAIMLGACKKIAQQKINLKRSLIFCFQPGQQGKGGAKILLQNYPQLLKGVRFAFALHSGNHFKAGYVINSPGIISANSNKFEIIVKGKSCHVMSPQSGIDANLIGCNLVSQLYALKQNKLSPLEQGTLCIVKVQGGQSVMCISQRLKIQGSLRMVSSKSQQKMMEQIQKLARSYCHAHGAQSQVKFIESFYRCVQNGEKASNFLKNTLKQFVNEENIKEQKVSFNGQDFCQFSQRIQSSYFILGTGIQDSFNQNNQSCYPIHSNIHQLDQRFMLLGLKIWVNLAFKCQ